MATILKTISALLFLSIATNVNAQNFEALNPNINIDDSGAIYYSSSRCSAIYLVVSNLLKNKDSDASKIFQEAAETLVVIVYLIDSDLNNISSEEAVSRSNNIISEMVKLYTEDMESNYIKTGSYYNNTYIADDC